jgi:hypothetical protein
LVGMVSARDLLLPGASGPGWPPGLEGEPGGDRAVSA